MIVFLHPLPFDGTVWSEEIRSIAPSIAPNLHDCGDDIGAWAEAAIAFGGRDPLDLVGNSVGASCALEIAARVPERVRSITFIGGKAGHRPEPEFRDEALRLLGAEGGLDAAWARYWAPLFTNRAVVDDARASLHRVGVAAVTAGVRAFHTRPDRHAFALSLDVPVLVVSGEFDLDPRAAEAFAAELRRGSFVQLEGVGHYAPLEAPQQLRSIVADFLRT